METSHTGENNWVELRDKFTFPRVVSAGIKKKKKNKKAALLLNSGVLYFTLGITHQFGV